MMKNSKPQALQEKGTDYGKYHFNSKEWFLYSLQGGLLVTGIAYFFYRSALAGVLLIPVFFLFIKEKKKELAKKRQEILQIQFKDMVLSLCASQKAGYSIENAVQEAYRDMAMLYGEKSDICQELRLLKKGMENNIVLEKLLCQMGKRSHVPDIIQFADVFWIAKRSGGNMTEILTKTADTIEQKTEVDKEIQVLISAKQMEQRIMNIVPFLIIFYISITSKGFFDVLYHNPAGVVIMSVCLFVYFAAYRLSKQIVAIKV